MQSNAENKQQVIVFGKKSLEANGITSVSSLSEEGIILESEDDNIAIEGDSLKIENFEKSTNKILITGAIKGIYYLEKRTKKKGRNIVK